ncbi:MAG: uracil-DNA glycosylase [Planctomycetes bacterium]|nr:uracil-DNA glycosylase [Planctomycetota bacterium]
MPPHAPSRPAPGSPPCNANRPTHPTPARFGRPCRSWRASRGPESRISSNRRAPRLPRPTPRANHLRPLSPPQTRGGRPAQGDDRAAALAEVRREVAACTRCAELVGNRTQTVFGVGDPHARLVFLGEAPGADEDRQGEPFVGRAGQLLTRVIEACTLKREDVYICNILRCRPPGNRNPLPEEAAACREYLDRQLTIIQPEFICCLGSVAAQNLLDTTVSIGRLRGRFQDYNGIQVLCTYHPAYLLRNPSAKRLVWEDMQLLMAEMGIELPER